MRGHLFRLVLGTIVALAATAGIAQAQNLSWTTAARLNAVPITQLACPSVGQCTALDHDRFSTYENTFAPKSAGRSTRRLVDHGTQTSQLSCPTTSLCAFGDASGDVVAFNPVTRAKPVTWKASTAAITAVSCPRATECVAVDADGAESVYSPAKPTASVASGVVSSGVARMDCPTTTECVVVGTSGAETFNPLAPPQGSAVSYLLDDKTALIGLSCPSSSDCTALDVKGNTLTFNPLTLGLANKPTPRWSGASAKSEPVAISCAWVDTCVVVSSKGTVREGNPMTGKFVDDVFKHYGALTSVACPKIGVCLAGDSRSYVYAGTYPEYAFVTGAGKATVGYIAQTTTGLGVTLSCSGSGNVACTFVMTLSGGVAGQIAKKTITLEDRALRSVSDLPDPQAAHAPGGVRHDQDPVRGDPEGDR